MKKSVSRKEPATDRNTMRPEYDFSSAVRGVTAPRYAQGANIVVIDPDVLRVSERHGRERDPPGSGAGSATSTSGGAATAKHVNFYATVEVAA